MSESSIQPESSSETAINLESSNNSEGQTNSASCNSEAVKGVVKWFNDAKGFGFIQHPNGKDVFVHFSTITSEGFKTLKDGEEVEYEFHEGPKGLQATKVLRVKVPTADATNSETTESSDKTPQSEKDSAEQLD